MAYSERDQALIDEVISSFEAVLVPARLQEHVSQDAIRRLLRAVEAFGHEWAERKDIPKSVAIWFRDSMLLRSWAQSYPGDIRRELDAAATALNTATARAIVGRSDWPPPR